MATMRNILDRGRAVADKALDTTARWANSVRGQAPTAAPTAAATATAAPAAAPAATIRASAAPAAEAARADRSTSYVWSLVWGTPSELHSRAKAYIELRAPDEFLDITSCYSHGTI